MIWWLVRILVVVVIINLVVKLAGWVPEMWSLEWWMKSILVGFAAYAVVGPSEED